MERVHKIIIEVDRDLERIRKIDLEPDGRLHGDSLAGLLAKSFRPAVWAAVRKSVVMDGRRVFASDGGVS